MTTRTRASLSDFSPPLPSADDGKVERAPAPRPAVARAAAVAERPAETPAPARKKYPHVSVYLPAETIKQLKLIAIEHEVGVNDLCVEAIEQWMAANGHARSRPFKG